MGGGTAHPLPPIGVISDTNQSGLILILTGLSLSFVLVAFAIRVYSRHPKGLWKLDDNFLTGATILACAQSGVIVRAVNVGLGDIEYVGSAVVEKLYFSSHYLYILELLLSKLAIAALYLRLTRARKHRYTIWSIVGSCILWTIVAILLISIRYSWPSAFRIPFTRWLVVGVIDCSTDAALALMSVYLVKDLQLSVERKAIVIAAFGVRLLTIIPCAMRLYYLHPDTIPHNRILATSLAVVCTQLQLGYAIMAASVAVLKPFMVVYDKPESSSSLSGSQHLSNPSHAYYKNASAKSQNRSKAESSFKMQSLRSNQSIKSQKSARGGDMVVGTNEDQIGPVSGRSTRVITSGPFPERKNSVTSHESQKKMIIERRDEWSIKYEEDFVCLEAATLAPATAAPGSESGSGSGSGSAKDGESSLGVGEAETVVSWAPGGIGVAQ